MRDTENGSAVGRTRFKGRAFASIAIAAIILIAVSAIVLLRILPPEMHDSAEFGIAPYTSPNDSDGDGVDDQTDILASARAYTASSPRYRSAYYPGGRPDDGYGVCTDVEDRALLGAGMDLQGLVDADIRSAPEAYGIEVPDANIDFRRVRNLRVFFDRNAQSLTLDTSDIAGWQGGDIVCWPDHIGIVSDKRNARGVPLVIHHGNPFQIRYEEDVLENPMWGPIVGHWRMG
ncbi:MAG: DUF1287 domain-containing protein [Atopobiaceae bacterium]|nr:DUF1287 domain-containing protein [Atopobiaceae bacterium]